MLEAGFYSITSVVIVSLISLIGVFTLAINESRLNQILLLLVSFSAGALFGDAFVHLLPEAVEKDGFSLWVSTSLLIGILLFFILEKIIHWRHCHVLTSKKHPHPLVFTNLIGDGLHNFTDGVIIAGSYLSSIPLGVTTTIAVILHEIPQEIGDFGVLLHAGLKRAKALFFNLLSASFSIIGAVLTLLIGNSIANINTFLIPFTAGGFIYIAGTDLIPELHKTCHTPSKSISQLIAFILGIGLMFALVLLE